MQLTYVFVGEKRSDRAIALDASWQNGKLAAKTLHEALRAAGIEPSQHFFRNLYVDGTGWTIDADVLKYLLWISAGATRVVALGTRVAGELERYKVPHMKLIHPAARGAIRARAKYHAHVAEVLCSTLSVVEEAAA